MTMKMNAKMLAKVAAHAAKEGAEDYTARASDVACGDDAEWAWPFATADEAYINAMGTDSICRDLKLPDSAWDEIQETWLDSFESAYVAAGIAAGECAAK